MKRVATVMACICLVAALGLVGLLVFWGQAAQTTPWPSLPEGTPAEEDGFPLVDWNYWLSVNPDIVGWITVPDTAINNPIVQAPADDPDYYLSHDIYGTYNPYGAIYLDAECADEGLDSPNAVILGHHVEPDTGAAPFGVIAEYASSAFAFEHATVLIQTPHSRAVYQVRFVDIVNGAQATKRTAFLGGQDFVTWYEQSLAEAHLVLDAQARPDQVVSLVSCSYAMWAENERTVVTCSQVTLVGGS